ncbi:MAG TPA: hypothetical protein VN688_03395 [Gemmataceae bacterium]|nr:hypothetical protein [Gemmataceae bacterium]
MDGNQLATSVEGQTFARGRRLKRRRLRDGVLFAVPVLATLTIGYLHFTSPPPAISRGSYERITVGMSERDVEKIIRARPGGYKTFCGPGESLKHEWGEAGWWSRWGNGYGILAVGYDTDGRVCAKRLEYHPRLTPEQPEQWSWWRRLVNRSVPKREPNIIYISF